MQVLRNVVAAIAGIGLGVLLVILGEAAGHTLWPPPPGLDPSDPQAMRDYLAAAPFAAVASLPLTWTLAAFAGAYVAVKISGRLMSSWIAGGVLFASTLANLILIRHPVWVLAASVIAMPLAILLAARLAAPKPAAPPAIEEQQS